jgi:hypothetical protein
MLRIGFLVITALFLAPRAFADDAIRHLVDKSAWAAQPTVPDSMAQRVDDAAITYQKYAPVPRLALFDVAYPASDAELAEMAGYGVLLVTALSQDASELPPKRLYGVINGTGKTLSLISATTSATTQSPTVSKVLGSHRWDALYLFPVYLTRDGAKIAMDFAAHRKGFVLGTFSSADQKNLNYKSFVADPPRVASPPADVVMNLIAREFPGFLKQDVATSQMTESTPSVVGH